MCARSRISADLAFADRGGLWFTEQGQTGVTDPSDRVFGWSTEGRLSCPGDRVPGPNGIVLTRTGNAVLVATRENAIRHRRAHPAGSTSKGPVFTRTSGGGGPDPRTLYVTGSESGTIRSFPPLPMTTR